MRQNIGRNSMNYGRNNFRNIRKEESEVKSNRITVQVTAREKEVLKLLAKREGQTPSEYIRSCCIWGPYNRLTGGDDFE